MALKDHIPLSKKNWDRQFEESRRNALNSGIDHCRGYVAGVHDRTGHDFS